MTAYDVAAVRAHFPALRHGAAHFDGPGGTLTPAPVAQRVYDTLVEPLANRGTAYLAARNAEQAVLDCREALADLMNADPRGIIFGRSMSQITFDLSRAIAQQWGPGDEVIVTRLDHDSNIRGWVLAAQARGATVRWADFDPQTGELDTHAIASLLTPRTRLVAVTAASNLIGTMPDIAAISQHARQAGALVYVDGVHYSAHALVDVEALGADFFGCSPYKFLGPHCAAVYGRPELLEAIWPDKLLPATNEVPERFELGTLPYELMAGTAAAVDFLASLAPGDHSTRRARLQASLHALEAHEDSLRAQIEASLATLPGATIYSRAARRSPTLLASFAGHDSSAIAAHLAASGVNAPAGSFYALEASRHLGLGDAGALRIGLAPYNDQRDVERLLDALADYFRQR